MLEKYQKLTDETAIYPDAGTGSTAEYLYLSTSLGGEVGEVLNVMKKCYRDGELNTIALWAELGDVMWYILRICHVLNWNLENVIIDNHQKLTDRKLRGKLGGGGDKR